MKKAVIIMGIIIVILSIALYAKKVLHVNISQIINPIEKVQNQIQIPPTSTSSSQLRVQVYAKDLPGARVITFDPNGVPIVSLTSSGKVVALPDTDKNNQSDKTLTLVDRLNKPHGLVFSGNTLLVAETDKVVSYSYDQNNFTLSNKKVLFTLPSGSGHFTRSLLIKDNKLYTAIGSSCNVCNESDSKRASILQSNLDGSNLRTFVTGLRNSVFQTVNPQTNEIWVTEMGRDNLGDDVPPDEINILKENGNYGWPICYGNNIHDSQFDKNQYIQNPCTNTIPSRIDLQAHSAPLGIGFVPDSWNSNYQNKIIVAYHGSWNRSIPTGYKLVLIDPQTNIVSDLIDLPNLSQFISRPVDVKFNSTGQLFVSDDKLNHIVLITQE